MKEERSSKNIFGNLQRRERKEATESAEAFVISCLPNERIRSFGWQVRTTLIAENVC